MSQDLVSRGLAVRAFRARPRETVTVLVLGQSNEQGPVPRSQHASHPLAFRSALRPGVAVPLGSEIPVVDRGGWWCMVHDELWDWGYELEILNGAIGGMNILTHLCGAVQARSDNTAYYQRRATPNYPDRGDWGDIISFGGKYFRVNAGRNRSALCAGPLANPSGSSTNADFVSFEQSGPLSAGSAPDASAAAVGSSVTDGGLGLITLDSTRYGSSSIFLPGNESGQLNTNLGGVLGEQNAGHGFDPLSLLARGWDMLRRSNASRKLVYFSQGQSNLGTGAVTYMRAVMIAMNYFLRRGVEVMIGNTCYSPGSSGSTSTNYENKVAGVQDAIASLSAVYPGKVHAGANLYGLMGASGPMGGQRFTASIAGSVLTVSAVTFGQGSGLAVGQRVWNGTSLVGTIASLGTGAGGTGTYNLDGAADTASTALISAGAFLQYDGVHLSGAGSVGADVAGVSCAGKHVADAVKAVLPQHAL